MMFSIRRLAFPLFSALALMSSSFVQADLLADVKGDLQPFIMRCNNPARAWIRILFHDAANGACDGSIQ